MNKDLVEFLCGFVSSEETRQEVKRKLSGKDNIRIMLDALDAKHAQLDAKVCRLLDLSQALHVHPASFGEFKGAFSGKDVVLVGTGPSLERYRVIEDAVHIGVNWAIKRKDIHFQHLFVQTTKPFPDGMAAVNSYGGKECTKFYAVPSYLNNEEVNAVRVKMRDVMAAEARPFILESTLGGNIAIDVSRMPLGDFGSVMFSALQFALYGNPRRIFLVGVDCSNQGYFLQDRKPLPWVHWNGLQKYSGHAVFTDAWLLFRDFIATYYFDQVEIISVNPVGLKGLFSDVEQ